jgi:SAM-dependent methyltransferase
VLTSWPITASERWIAATWPFVRSWLPPTSAQVVDLGCGSEGGFVPSLRADGYDAIGIDPQAPAGAHYQRAEFEGASLPEQLEAAVASTSLHHVADPAHVIDRITTTLTRGGRLVVVEWAWENFDEETADWCFTRLGPDDEAGWLHHRRDGWLASGLPCSNYLRDWADGEHLHRGDELIRLLDERLQREVLESGPYFFPDLADTTAADEQAAIDAGVIKATRIHWAGSRK